MKMKVVGGLLILAFAALGAVGFMKSLTPYVSFSEAKASASVVQLKGKLDKSRIGFDKMGNLNFYIRDDSGVEMKVVYDGPKPGNFEQASHVVAAGVYRDGAFRAERVLVKCPSKYQGQVSGSE